MVTPPAPFYCDEWCTLYNGDALEILPTFDDGAGHLLLLDPPYFNVVDEEWDTQWGTDARAFLAWLASVLVEAERVTHERGSLAVFSSPDMAAFVEMEVRRVAAVFNSMGWVDSARATRKRCARFSISEKCRNPDGDLFRFRSFVNHKVTREVHKALIDRMIALQQSANLTNREVDKLLGKNGMAGHYFGRSQWCLPTAEAWAKISELAASRGVSFPPHEELAREFESKRREFEGARREFDSDDAPELENLSDIWTFTPPPPSKRTAGHPTEKPEALIRHMITTMTRRGDTIIDPFSGSGTTLRVARDLGRHAIGIELDPGYCQAIVERIAQGCLFS